MGYPGMGSLDTPRTNVGDATFLNRPPDFDVSQEATFHSPTKEDDIFHQMRNGGGRPSLRTPRGGNNAAGRAPFSNRLNLPAGIGGVEFTPLLKSATRNSARRPAGKENGATGAVPFSLDRIDEDYSRIGSFVESTPLPNIDSSSIMAATPIAMRQNNTSFSSKNKDGPLQDGNQLSLREQENVIDRIEKENFGLKLKIHFLEEALRKAGPGFSEAALKENTELKVDKVTLQRELHRYKKLVASAEQNLENYRREMHDMQDKMAQRHADKDLRAEVERLREELAAKNADLDDLQRQANAQAEKLRDDIEDLEADVREKDRIISQKEDELEELQLSMEARLEDNRQHIQELEEKAGSSEKLDEAKETIEGLEADVRRLEQQSDEMKTKLDEAVTERQRAEDDLEELQEEMANKSVHTKGLSRQVEEKLARLQTDVDKAQRECAQLSEKRDEQAREADDLKQKLKESRQARDDAEREALSASTQLKEVQADLNMLRDQKALLQTRHDALTNESASLQRDVSRLQKTVAQLEADVEAERQHGAEAERNTQVQFLSEIDRLSKEISNLRTEIAEKEHLYDIDSDKWDTDRQHLEAERDRLQQSIDRLREAEGALSGKEAQLKELMDGEKDRHDAEEAVLRRQLESAQKQLQLRQETLDSLRKELASVRDELRTADVNNETLRAKAERLQDEVDALQAALDSETSKARAGSSSFNTSTATAAATATSQQLERLRQQLTESSASLAKSSKDKQELQQQVADINTELHSLRSSLTEAKAERDEMEEELRRAREHEGETFRLDHERIDLRTAKMKLDGEVRRLREENKALAEQCQTLEKTLEEELDKAASEEERLGQEIRELQSERVRSTTTESQELQAARRAMRELERRIQDHEIKAEAAAAAAAAKMTPVRGGSSANVDGDNDTTGEIGMLRRDLTEARAKERAYLQREAAQKDAVKTLRRQIVDLERAAHEAEINRLMGSPSVTEDVESAAAAAVEAAAEAATRQAEIRQLRDQLTAAQQAGNELRRTVREMERRAATWDAAAGELDARMSEMEEERAEFEARIGEVEEERAVLEQALDEAQDAAAETVATMQKMQVKLERYRNEREELALALADAQHNGSSSGSGSVAASEMSREERSNLHAMLRKTQVEAEALERELRDHRTALDEAARTEDALRVKLDRARSERAAHRADAERLRNEVEELQAAAARTRAALHYGTGTSADAMAVAIGMATAGNGETSRELILATAAAVQHHEIDTDALVRAAEEQSIRHHKELRGFGMQVEWMQARWEREARLRCGAVLAKQLLSQDLEMRIACNKADLRMLQGILRQLGVREPTLLSGGVSDGRGDGRGCRPIDCRARWRRALVAVCFVVRVQKAAVTWAQHEVTRQRLVAAAEGMRKAERMQQMRTAWRQQLAVATMTTGGRAPAAATAISRT
ncbi:spindle-pole body protein [Grosmannia clavigera kw1407]|uniref:Spindle-pole body protein n=1 Tax=Grosmannia clavigera (strain kw1407 / UAMH 11150) TaxID=655863 RepID=F0XRJ3_GROCL|nr:spindle-pole body protein [Grosmannia clavigera kw1407]EFW99816.1 spindle-pole body protein [Grosmannia clavigera kw1407]